MEQDRSHSRQYRFARHLEVFVPNNPKFKGRLRLWLDGFMLKKVIPMTPSDARARPILLRESQKKIAEILEGKEYWENIIYGYSIYKTEGHFLRFSREIHDYMTEQTLVIKFILTNYVTYDIEELINISILDDSEKVNRIATLLSWGFPRESEFLESNKYLEFYCAYLHYKDISNYIITQISQEVLQEEEEVWAQSWHTVLDRRLKEISKGKDSKKGPPSDSVPEPPIVQRAQDKAERFGENYEKVLCVIDYSTRV